MTIHSSWKKAAKKGGIEEVQIPEILQHLGMDPDHPSPTQVKSFTEACNLISSGQSIEAAAQQVIAAVEQPETKENAMASRGSIQEIYPEMDIKVIDQLLLVLGIEGTQEEFAFAKVEEFKSLCEFVKAGQLEEFEEICQSWEQYKNSLESSLVSDAAAEPEALTVSSSVAVAAPSKMPDVVQASLSSLLLESAEEDVAEVPQQMAAAKDVAQSNVMDGIDDFVKSTYYQAVESRMQTPEFLEEVREALRSGKSRGSSGS